MLPVVIVNRVKANRFHMSCQAVRLLAWARGLAKDWPGQPANRLCAWQTGCSP